MMTILTRASDRQTVSLGNKIASSGEGEVWETNFSGILAKIYHNPTPERIEKLKAMLANPPVDPMAGKNHVSIAFPQDLLQDGSGNCVGFLMPAVRSSRELPSIYNPRLRKRNAPGFNWYYLHITALNTAWIIQAIHEKGYVLGDIKPQNILVNDRALVAVIDTDSFQVCDRKSGKVYRCTVGSDGFTPVELLGKDFAVTDQSEVCDRFRLAVLIHYLLFGYHPFSGEWTGVGESPDQTELIRKGLWYGGNSSLIRPSQNTIPLDVIHPEIKRLFLKCFNDGHASPKLRPTAEDWHNALQVAVNDLTICGKVDSHHYSRNYSKCYWCERSVKLSVDIFPSVPGTTTPVTNTTTSSTRLTNQKQHILAQRQATTTPLTATQNTSSSISLNQTSKQLASPSTGHSHTNQSSHISKEHKVVLVIFLLSPFICMCVLAGGSAGSIFGFLIGIATVFLTVVYSK
ncbi:helix-hairpin-helix domain-containing protein [Aliterella atlantica]|uniref:helix-hairpin-helix domain-containing protein n=1 Tax=Aliterella atlantica TaxID=1827278 RepID=UPI000A7BB700|nr:hypothetical protein [Aliterella atlantica]